MTGSPSSSARCAVRCSIASSGSTLQRRSSIVWLVVPQMYGSFGAESSYQRTGTHR